MSIEIVRARAREKTRVQITFFAANLARPEKSVPRLVRKPKVGCILAVGL